MFTYANSILPHLHVGASLVIQPAFDADEALQAIEAHDVTNVIAVPAQLKQMVAQQREAEYDLSSLRRIRTGGAPTTETLVENVAETLGADIRVLYGLSEGGATVTHSYPHEQRERPYTVGKEAFMWNVRVVTPADPPAKPDPNDIVDPGGTGEVLVKGPAMATGYLDNPDAEEALFVDGWIRTRDVADVDAEGYLSIVDRVDNMLVSGGEKIYPQEVERVLTEHPGVSEVCVVGVADERWGQTVAAIVVPAGDVDQDTLDSFCVEHDGLADFKRPRLYAFAEEELPRTASGTLERVTIRERYFGDRERGG
jgi:fatty-acyl-CoA synthase